ncbi:MAG: nucleoside hydrolase [Clostridia bacterium]|nr:nucleoside hydrolase [Clostridia bacterium]
MKLNEILTDLRSDRIKKVILDCDAYNDIDDQFAIAFAAGSDKMELLSVNAALFNNYRCNGFEDGMIRSYNEIVKELRLLDLDEKIPAFKGCPVPLSQMADNTPVDSDAVRNIIKTVHGSDEIIYVIATGAVTNVSSAIMTDPTIKDNMCVIWVGCNTLDFDGPAGDFNHGQDEAAGRYILNCGVNLIILPAMGPEGSGTQMLVGDQSTLDVVKGDSPAAVYFREELPELAYPGETGWTHHFWDVAGPGLIHDASAFDLSVIMAPRIRLDCTWAFEPGRHDIIYMNRLDPQKVLFDTFTCIGKLV